MTETKRTDKEVLVKGLKFMGGSLVCMFIGPTLIYISQTKVKSPIDTILLIIAILICGFAIYLAFRGINIILDSMFKKKNS
ncbi:DUF6095 family protein [Seonamhaeicola aphaedonensis]|uniref:Uncharacterized protein n=1 Tax=Seonamhaeicola aphaedonensis TaxID=1461338 RepID=A0A3D9HA85_9FLAO|nr:DUF6095 family protein [Seonamhaeicola aphaedonensis]RED46091.1 hypothetical protein DFQ02_107241 [Seonamhaeicola aphaedonensis]